MTQQPENAPAALPIGHVWAPRFDRAEGINLIAAANSLNRVKRRATQRLLDQFCNICETAPNTLEATIRFAKNWGMIGLCSHGLPVRHSQPLCAAADTVDGYASFSRCLNSLLRLGLELNLGNIGEETDWENADILLCGPDFPPRDKNYREFVLFPKALNGSQKKLRHIAGKMIGEKTSRPIVAARTEFQMMMRRLIQITGLIPRFSWQNDGWAIEFDSQGSSNLAAIMTVQLMARIGGKLMRKCRNCPRWFQPIGRQRYCTACGTRAARRDASRRYRAKTLAAL